MQESCDRDGREIKRMNVAQHADQILAAWKRADPASFEEELNDAMRCCQRAEPANYFESEQREVLASVVERLRLIRPLRSGTPRAAEERCTPQSLHVGFSLLEHLRQRAAA
jgi:hypothetical protein